MIDAPHIIIIGAAGRHVGKTEFCCELIRQQAKKTRVVGIKITPVEELESDFLITEENGSGTKDTARMIAAGATTVYWLRATRENLGKGIEALMGKLPPQAVVVCESTSGRLHLTPGLFMIIKDANSDLIKPTCEPLMHYADRLISFREHSWDFTPDQISFSNGRWQISEGAES